MSKELIYCVVHVTATPYGRKVTADDIYYWHCFPSKNANGTFTYRGKNYKKATDIPNESYVINGKKLGVRDYPNGRGWSTVGYRDLINIEGEVENLVPYNSDKYVDSWEMSNGASGYNAVSHHVTCAGGGSKSNPKITSAIMDVEEVLNPAQIKQLVNYLKAIKQIHPNIKIVGHHELDGKKTCPNFDVQKFCKTYGI